MLLGKADKLRMCGWIEQESQKIVLASNRNRPEKIQKISIYRKKISPLYSCSVGCTGKPSALPSCNVRQRPRGPRCAAWHLTVATDIAAPVAAKPTGPVAATQHS